MNLLIISLVPNKLDLNDYDDVDLIAFLHFPCSRSLLLLGCFK